jgi:hypothetical protein
VNRTSTADPDLCEASDTQGAALSAELAWLRGRLARAIGTRGDGSAAAAATEQPPEASPALQFLGQRFALSRFEQQILLLCAAAEFDPAVARACAHAQDAPERPYPTFALALALLDEPVWEALSPQGALRYWRLIELDAPDFQGLLTSRIRIAERILHFLKGLDCMEESVAALLAPAAAPRFARPPACYMAAARKIQTLVHQWQTGHAAPVIRLRGADLSTRTALGAWAVRELGWRPWCAYIEDLPAQQAELAAFSLLWDRECALQPCVLLLTSRAAAADTLPESALAPVRHIVQCTRSPAILAIDEPGGSILPHGLLVELPEPTRREQQAAWEEALGTGGHDHALRLAAAFDLQLGTISEIALQVSARCPERFAELWQACLASTRRRFGRLAERLVAGATWRDLVLPAPQLTQLRSIADQVKHRAKVYEEWGFGRECRGLGISALFSGESGTGKTMAAEVIATELGFDLYRIDLSAVMSKYIGETEKNLREIFTAAEGGGIILFFDEADALYGRRSEVKDSHDRYANIEISYLLQRIESYRGLSILATNRRNALDHAFLRRLRFIVDFPYPTCAARRTIWARAFPAGAPTGVLDLDRLAALNLTGSSIRTVAMNAAFMAADSNGIIDMRLVLAAAADELRKLGRADTETS